MDNMDKVKYQFNSFNKWLRAAKGKNLVQIIKLAMSHGHTSATSTFGSKRFNGFRKRTCGQTSRWADGQTHERTNGWAWRVHNAFLHIWIYAKMQKSIKIIATRTCAIKKFVLFIFVCKSQTSKFCISFFILVANSHGLPVKERVQLNLLGTIN